MAEIRIPEVSSETLHAACVAIDGKAVLVEGRAPEDRCDLALRLIDRGATLVADDCTICQRKGGALLASAPAGSAGRIDIRGIGKVAMPAAECVPVALLVVILDSPPRFPEDSRKRRVAGADIPILALSAADAAAPIKVELAIRQAAR